jgi:hypothetical protein
MLLVLIAGAAIGLATFLVFGRLFADDPVTKADIEHEVAQRPRGGKVQLVLCNEQFVPSQNASADPPQTWTCDTYLGPSKSDAQLSGDRQRRPHPVDPPGADALMRGAARPVVAASRR